jgi:hypothetical protein
MAKTDAQRIEQTIVFLEHLPDAVHQFGPAAGNALRAYQQGNALQVVSKSMSLGAIAPHRRAHMENFRHARRAVILVRAVLLNQPVQQVRQQVDQLADANLNQALSQAINAWAQTEQQKLNTTWAEFTTNTATFLTSKKIYVDSNGGPGAVNYYWGWDQLNSRYLLTGTSTTRTPVVSGQPVFHIPTTPYVQVSQSLGQLPTLKVTRSPCVTTQLTGCSYAFYVDPAGELYATHVWPKGDIGAIDLCTDLRRDAKLQIAPGNTVKPQVFGACPANNGLDYKHAGTKTYVVAVGGTGNWEVHIQQQVGAAINYWRVL